MAEAVVTTLLSAEEIAAKVEALAVRIAPAVDDDTVAVCLLTGGLWFAADLTRALHRQGRSLAFDALWLASYGDERMSSGSVVERAGLQRSVEGRRVLVIDDVFDSGLSLLAAKRICEKQGAAEVKFAVFARKPWPRPRDLTPDFIAWDAPARFLAGYGMDVGGKLRGLPVIVAMD